MIYLVRHAESYINVSIGKIEPEEDKNSELTKIGQWQAERLADYFSDKNISKIISSPYERTLQTSNSINESTNCEIVKEDLIKEVDYGDLSKYANPMKYADQKIKDLWSEDYTKAYFPNGESFQDIEKRSRQFLDNLINSTEDIIVVSHRDIIRMCLSFIKDDNHKSYWLSEIAPASIHLVDINNHKYEIMETDIESHLK